MPTIPLHIEPPPDAPAAQVISRQVRAPGGFERWRFVADDGGIRVEIAFIIGDHDNPAYRRAHRRYLSRPTRHPPPVPRDFAAVSVVLEKAGRLVSQRRSRSTAAVSTDGRSVQIGRDRFSVDEAGRIHLSLNGDIAAELMFHGPRSDVEGWITADRDDHERLHLRCRGAIEYLWATSPPAE